MLLLAATSVATEAAVVNWTDATGFWDVVTNWSSNPALPGATDDVVINVAGVQTITHRSGIDIVQSLTITDDNLAVTGTSLTVSGTFGNTGNTSVSAGNLTLNGVSTLSTLALSGTGTLAGTGAVTLSGALTWTSGEMTSTGTTNANGGITLGGTTQNDLTGGRILNSSGTTTWTNAANQQGRIRTGGGAVINNSGSWLDQNAFATRISNDFAGAASTFNNTGTYTKSGNATTTIDILFNNTSSGAGTGVVTINAGTLNLSGGGTSNGSFLGTGTLQFGGGTHTLAAASTITLPNVTVSAGTVNLAGTYNVSGTTTVTGGTAHFTGAVTNNAGAALVVSGGTADFSNAAPVVFSTVNLSGSGTIAGTQTLTSSGLLTWTGGEMNGLATTNANGGIALGGTTQNDLTGSRILNSPGTTTWTNAANQQGRIRTGAGAVINNSGSWLDQNGFATRMSNDFGGAQSTFNNTGTYTKSGDATTTIAIRFNNTSSGAGTGVVNINAGILELTGGGTTTGSFLGTGTLEFGGGTHDLTAASTITLPNVTVSAGTANLAGGYNVSGTTTVTGGVAHFTGAVANLGGALVVSGGTADFSNAAPVVFSTINLPGGKIAGPQTVTSSGLLTWTGGEITGLATTNANGGIALGGTTQNDLSAGRILNSPGTTTWTNAANQQGRIRTGGGAVINNSGSWLDQNPFATRMSNDFAGAASTFNNTGTYTKSGDATTTIAIRFNNTSSGAGTGVVNINAGTLELTGGGTSNGSFLGTGTLEFGGNTHNLSAASTITLPNVTVSGGTVNLAGSYNVSGTTTVTGGAAHFTGAVANLGGALVVSGGTADFSNAAPVVFSSINLSGSGIITGPQTITSSGLLTWTGGDMTGLGTTNANGGIALGGTTQNDLSGGRILNSPGTTTWTNAANQQARIRTGAGAVINNSGSWLDQNPFTTQISNDFGGVQSTFNNTGMYEKSGASTTNVNINLVNSGTVDVKAGTLALNNGMQGTGTLQIGAPGAVTVGAASTVGKLVHNGTGATSLDLGIRNITVSDDYVNASSGVGNSFNRRANVAGTGQILASGNVAQAITGTTVTGGTTATPTLSIGNVHVGSTTVNYQIANSGTTGPALRGALQTAVNGGNITDARLSGAGVTASNWGPVTPGANSGDLAVTFTAAGAGALSPLVGQVVHVANNFDNVAPQNLSIVLAPGAAAYNLAAASVTPDPVVLPNQRVNTGLTQALTVTNTAPAGAFTEGLNATFGSNSGAANKNGGSVSLLAGGASNSAAMSVGVDSSSPGAKTGTVTVNLASDGTGTSGLGVTPLTAKVLDVSGNVYRIAQPSLGSNTFNFGNVHVGATAQAALSLTNTSAAPAGFQEGLNAGLSGATPGVTAQGFIVNLPQGASDTTNLLVGIDTSSPGSKNGTATLNLASNGTGTSGLSSLGLAPATINVSGAAFNLAQATLGTLNFGNVLVNSPAVQQALSVSNAPGPFREGLNAAFGAITNSGAGSFTTNSGSITNLAAGSTDNATMVVTLTPSSAGAINASFQILLASNGLGTSNLGITGLPDGTVLASGTITGVAGNLASAGAVTPNPVNFGNVRIGSTPTQNLTISNVAAAPGEGLNATFGTTSGAATNNGGTITSLPPGAPANSGATNTTAMAVGLNTSVAGARTGSVQINFQSDGTFNSGVPTTLPSQTVDVQGTVFRLANPTLNTPGINLVARVGDASPSTKVSLTNTSPDAFTEGLKASIGATPAAFAASGSIANLTAALTDATSLAVALQTGTAGTFAGTATLNFTSTGAGTTGAVDVAVGTGTVNLSGKVYTPAVADVPKQTFDFGIVHKGDSAPSQVVEVRNVASVTALNDTLTGSFGAVTSPFTGVGTLGAGVVAGTSNNSSLSVGMKTDTAGSFAGTAALALASHNVDLADIPIEVLLNVSGQVNNFANPDLEKVSGAGSFSKAGTAFVLNFGTLVRGTGIVTAFLALENDIPGNEPGDLLDALFGPNAPHFLLDGFSSYNDIAPGQRVGGLSIGLDTTQASGLLDEFITLQAFGHNPSGYNAPFGPMTLHLLGQIVETRVPEPSTIALLITGLVACAGASARRRR